MTKPGLAQAPGKEKGCATSAPLVTETWLRVTPHLDRLGAATSPRSAALNGKAGLNLTTMRPRTR